MGYVTAEEIFEFGIQDPSARDLIEQASEIIDQHVFYPINDDGWKFPRADDGGDVPTKVKRAVLEQILYMLTEGSHFIRLGGDNSTSISLPGGFSRTQPANDSPLLAPMAKLYLRGYMHRTADQE